MTQRLAFDLRADGPNLRIAADGYHFATIARGMNDRADAALRIAQLWNQARRKDSPFTFELNADEVSFLLDALAGFYTADPHRQHLRDSLWEHFKIAADSADQALQSVGESP